MKLWNLLGKIILAAAIGRLLVALLTLLPQVRTYTQPLSDPPPSPARQTAAAAWTAFPLPSSAKHVERINDDLSLTLSAIEDKTQQQTVALRCIALFDGTNSREAAKHAMETLLQESHGYLYLDYPSNSTEIHLVSGTYLQGALMATGWVKALPTPGCKGSKTLKLLERRAQQQRLGHWQPAVNLPP